METLPRSFRDPDGVTLDDGIAFLRLLTSPGEAKIDALNSSSAAKALVQRGQMIATEKLDGAELEAARTRVAGDWVAAVRHPRLEFMSFAHEWPATMLHAAGLLTLDIAEHLLAEDKGLKDASPYNVGFKGPVPIFLDVLSIETRGPTDPIWRAEAQFVRNFLLPLMCAKHFGIPAHSLLLRGPDTVTPEAVYKIAGSLRRLFPPFLWWVTLPAWLG